MGIFSEIGKSIGFVGDTVGGIIATNRTKRGLDQASDAEIAAFNEAIEAGGALRDRTSAATDPFSGAGTRATTTLEGLISGDQRLEPTAGELFARDRAFEGIDRASAAGKRLFSGSRLEEFGETAAGIGSQFRQHDISNLQNLAGRGLQATGLNINADISTTGSQNRLRELIGNVRSSNILGKTQADVGNIANISGNFAKLMQSGGSVGDAFAGGFG